MSEKNLTGEEAERLMKEDQIESFVTEAGKVIVKRTMDEHVSGSDWKEQASE